MMRVAPTRCSVRRSQRGRIVAVLLSSCLLAMAACDGPKTLMPTPRIYLGAGEEPWAGLDESLKTDTVRIFYFTDREPEGTDERGVVYGYGRSHSMAIGRADVRLGHGMSWDELVAASTTERRAKRVPLEIISVEERMRFPATPYPKLRDEDGRVIFDPAVEAQHDAAVAELHEAAAAAMAKTEAKDIYLFIHGYNNDFDDPIYVMAEMWHFLGRRGIPVVYTWPAGHPGPLRGYNYDRESSEFTVYHLQQAIEAAAGVPGLERLHIISHSRGTNVAADALRNLMVLAAARGEDPEKLYKTYNLFIISPDMDLDVMSQRLSTANYAGNFRRVMYYVSTHDKALGLAAWLFGSDRRAGRIRYDQLTEGEKNAISLMGDAGGVVSTTVRAGDWGHNYFYKHPGASADVISALRYDRDCGAEFGRPLTSVGPGFWELHDDYMLSSGDARRYEDSKEYWRD